MFALVLRLLVGYSSLSNVMLLCSRAVVVDSCRNVCLLLVLTKLVCLCVPLAASVDQIVPVRIDSRCNCLGYTEPGPGCKPAGTSLVHCCNMLAVLGLSHC